jgi:hypothetical protein
MSEPKLSESVTRVVVLRLGADGGITLTQDHCVEFMGPNGGPYEFYYDYDVYRFEEGNTAVTARSYRDEPRVASFSGLEIAGSDRPLQRADFHLPLVRAAVQHLRAMGKQELTWFGSSETGTYSPIPPVAAVDA